MLGPFAWRFWVDAAVVLPQAHSQRAMQTVPTNRKFQEIPWIVALLTALVSSFFVEGLWLLFPE